MARQTFLDQARQQLTGDVVSAALARRILPVLVRQAGGESVITYGRLAAELGRHHRGMNHALGRVGTAVQLLSRSWREVVPPLESLVVSGGDKLPRNGVDGFLIEHFKISIDQLNARRSEYCRMAAKNVQAYRQWPEVLAALELPPVPPIPAALFGLGASEREFLGGGEGPEHRALRLWLQDHPEAIGLHGWPTGAPEVGLASGDRVDVVFRKGRHVRAIEVKSRISKKPDIARGLYQCAKYALVLSLEASYAGRLEHVESLLVLEDQLPAELIPLRNHLGVECFTIGRRT